VAEQVRGDSITIGQVRRLAGWAHLTASGSRKVAVIENADRMQDSARNALLKLLEEPPEAVHLILLSSRRAAITPTILSRLRPYPFAQRSAAEEREVMEKIFRSETPGFESLRAFFLAWREINPEKLSQLARRFIDMVQAAEPAAGDIGAQMAEILPERKAQRDRSSRETGSAFLEELMARFRDLLRGGRVNVDTLEQWNQAVREAHARLETYNMNPSSILEALFYRMRDASRQQGDASRQQGDASRQQGDASRQQGDGARADNERRVSAGERARQEAGR
jgi:DNA polymerase-3 subunit gamma/tau